MMKSGDVRSKGSQTNKGYILIYQFYLLIEWFILFTILSCQCTMNVSHGIIFDRLYVFWSALFVGNMRKSHWIASCEVLPFNQAESFKLQIFYQHWVLNSWSRPLSFYRSTVMDLYQYLYIKRYIYHNIHIKCLFSEKNHVC